MTLCLYLWIDHSKVCFYVVLKLSSIEKKQTEEHLKLSFNICIDVCCCNELVRRKYFLRDLFISSH